MQNVSFASIPEQTSRPPVAVRTVPPNAPHNNSSDNPKSPSSEMHTSLKNDAPDAQPHSVAAMVFAVAGISPLSPSGSQLYTKRKVAPSAARVGDGK